MFEYYQSEIEDKFTIPLIEFYFWALNSFVNTTDNKSFA